MNCLSSWIRPDILNAAGSHRSTSQVLQIYEAMHGFLCDNDQARTTAESMHPSKQWNDTESDEIVVEFFDSDCDKCIDTR